MGEFRRPRGPHGPPGPPHTPGPPHGGGHGGGGGGGGQGGGNGGGGGNNQPKLGIAAQALVDMFKTYGLEGLADEVIKWVKNGVTGSELLFKVRQSDRYKKRFPGMAALDKQGYNAISEAQYLELEDNYHRALQTAGLPAGFYDSPQDFVRYMANGLDYTELYDRAVAAVDLANQSSPVERNMLRQLYGVGNGEIAAHFLDPDRAKPLLEKQLQVVEIAAAAKRSGVGGEFEKNRFERLQEAGITADQAAAGYSQIAQSLQNLSDLADIYGENYGIEEAENDIFMGNEGAMATRRRLADRESAAFSGRSGFVATEDTSKGSY